MTDGGNVTYSVILLECRSVRLLAVRPRIGPEPRVCFADDSERSKCSRGWVCGCPRRRRSRESAARLWCQISRGNGKPRRPYRVTGRRRSECISAPTLRGIERARKGRGTINSYMIWLSIHANISATHTWILIYLYLQIYKRYKHIDMQYTHTHIYR